VLKFGVRPRPLFYELQRLVVNENVALSEFQFIDYIKGRFSLDLVGDDCAVLPMNSDTDLLVTADLLVEKIDFRLEWISPKDLGHKSLAVSLSDIAAMGGKPTHALLSIGVPASLWKGSFLDEFYAGWYELAREFDVWLAGGDVSRSPTELVIDSILLGNIPRGGAVLRSGAKPGDLIFVSGELGSAAGGLKLLENGRYRQRHAQALVQHQHRPIPQVPLGMLLQDGGLATSMIDLSDGLSGDLQHICRASQTGARLFRDRIPVASSLAEFFSFEDALNLAVHGGEDFQLLFTVPPEAAHMARQIDDITQIGEITGDVGRIEMVTDGVSSDLTPASFEHFSNEDRAQYDF
jgi:thiamine-monophosphate kinase